MMQQAVGGERGWGWAQLQEGLPVGVQLVEGEGENVGPNLGRGGGPWPG